MTISLLSNRKRSISILISRRVLAFPSFTIVLFSFRVFLTIKILVVALRLVRIHAVVQNDFVPRIGSRSDKSFRYRDLTKSNARLRKTSKAEFTEFLIRWESRRWEIETRNNTKRQIDLILMKWRWKWWRGEKGKIIEARQRLFEYQKDIASGWRHDRYSGPAIFGGSNTEKHWNVPFEVRAHICTRVLHCFAVSSRVKVQFGS